MAKSRGFFSLRRGSTKSLTFSILNGKQITKDRVSEVRNPQTSRQMLQRVCFATVTQAAEKMLPIIGISQEGVTSEVESRRRWISQNVKLLRGIADRMSKGVLAAGRLVSFRRTDKSNLRCVLTVKGFFRCLDQTHT